MVAEGRERFAEIVANLVINWIIATVVASNADNVAKMTAAVVLLNVFGFLAGYFGGSAIRLTPAIRRALTIDVGVQNAGPGPRWRRVASRFSLKRRSCARRTSSNAWLQASSSRSSLEYASIAPRRKPKISPRRLRRRRRRGVIPATTNKTPEQTTRTRKRKGRAPLKNASFFIRLASRRPRNARHASHCATSFAQYVMMIVAPARWMEVSVSRTTRFSSIQPFIAAPFVMLYSPETLYAARGSPWN